jgi:hypothetical protein
MDWLWLGGEGPGEVPWWAGGKLTTEFKVTAENLNSLCSVQKTGFWQGKPVTFIRIYDPHASEEAWRVKDFSSLDQHPELILYEGYREKESSQVFLKRGPAPTT